MLGGCRKPSYSIRTVSVQYAEISGRSNRAEGKIAPNGEGEMNVIHHPLSIVPSPEAVRRFPKAKGARPEVPIGNELPSATFPDY